MCYVVEIKHTAVVTDTVSESFGKDYEILVLLHLVNGNRTAGSNVLYLVAVNRAAVGKLVYFNCGKSFIVCLNGGDSLRICFADSYREAVIFAVGDARFVIAERGLSKPCARLSCGKSYLVGVLLNALYGHRGISRNTGELVRVNIAVYRGFQLNAVGIYLGRGLSVALCESESEFKVVAVAYHRVALVEFIAFAAREADRIFVELGRYINGYGRGDIRYLICVNAAVNCGIKLRVAYLGNGRILSVALFENNGEFMVVAVYDFGNRSADYRTVVCYDLDFIFVLFHTGDGKIHTCTDI